MSKVEPKNVSASIRQRLLNLSQTSKRPFQEILQYYAMERFIHRFSESPYKNNLILKGGLMFYVWNLSSSRPTRDIDFLGITPNNPDNIQRIVTDICQIDYPKTVSPLSRTAFNVKAFKNKTNTAVFVLRYSQN